MSWIPRFFGLEAVRYNSGLLNKGFDGGLRLLERTFTFEMKTSSRVCRGRLF
jgi:hypothetical protein